MTAGDMFLKKFLCLVFSICYGAVIYTFSESYSFDFQAISSTIDYIRFAEPPLYEMIQLNNIVTGVFLNFIPDTVASSDAAMLLYGLAAAIRMLVFFCIFGIRNSILPFCSMIVLIDLNTSRYSLSMSATIVLIYLMHKWGIFRSIHRSFVMKNILSIPVLAVHHLGGFLFLITNNLLLKKKYLLFYALVGIVLIIFAQDIFARLYADTDEAHQRIPLVYLVFSIILIISYRLYKLFFLVGVVALFIVLSLFFVGHISEPYYLRFSLLIYDVTILTYLFTKKKIFLIDLSMPKLRKHIIGNELLYIAPSFVYIMSTTYTLILLGGNVWRFF